MDDMLRKEELEIARRAGDPNCQTRSRQPGYSLNLAEFLDKAGVAALLGISKRSVDSMLARGELPHIRFSKRMVRFPKAAILEAMHRRTVGVK